jgi:hypothetical protein
MKSRYSILLGMGIVIGLLFVVNIVLWDHYMITSDLFLFILLAGGYIVTYTSNIGKSRIAMISGIGISILLITNQLFLDKTNLSSVALISFLIIPGFIMLIGGFIAKLTKKEMDNLLNKVKSNETLDRQDSRL